MDAPDVGFIDRGPNLYVREFLGMRNRLGVFKLEATVWPRLTRRSMITPSTGEEIVQ